MKFENKVTKVVLVTNDKFVIEQLEKNSDYKKIVSKNKDTKKEDNDK